MSAQLTASLSALVVAAAVVMGVVTCVVTRAFAPGVPLFLDLLLAAGLVRLTADQSWRALATTATIVLVRKVAGIGIGVAARAGARPPAPDPPGPAAPGVG